MRRRVFETADADGSFRIGGLAHGDRLALHVSAPGFVRATIPLVKVDASLDFEEVEIRLREAAELSGRVTDEVTGAGVEGVRVRFGQTVRDGSAWAETDSGGEFRLRGFPVGAGVVTARADGYETFERTLAEPPREPLELVLRPRPEVDVAVEAGSEPYVELTVPLPGSLRVVVLGLETAEAAEVVMQVETRRDGGGTSSRTMTRATGGTATEPVFEMPFQEPEGTTTVIVAVDVSLAVRAPVDQ